MNARNVTFAKFQHTPFSPRLALTGCNLKCPFSEARVQVFKTPTWIFTVTLNCTCLIKHQDRKNATIKAVYSNLVFTLHAIDEASFCLIQFESALLLSLQRRAVPA